MSKKLHVIVIAITPFDQRGGLDENLYRRQLRRLRDAGWLEGYEAWFARRAQQQAEQPAAPAPEPVVPEEVQLLRQIRDSLQGWDESAY